ncbi:TonB-dependent receptor [Luteimonas aquatica]|uniref:TonB-dependent receptor n=1 Tax=Luteimonas aquatica TaxID=450364 RepID=UPI001F587006|nr:TonB-dependent receptor [Luteimonas aquatica]
MLRKPRPLRGAIRLALALSAAAAPFAHAAEPDVAADGSAPDAAAAPQDRTVQLDKIVVTGRSGTRERSKAETSYSITRIEEDRLRLQAPTSVTEAMKSVPGFWVEASGGEASGNIRARGIPVDGYGSVTLLEDGVPVQHDPALGYLNGDQAFRLDETIERIEVVRGGPSSVFYSNAPAGAINFVPRVVGDQAEGTFKMTVGDYGLARYDAFFGTPLGGGWKLGVGGFMRSDDGIRDPGFQANHGGQYRINLSRDFERGRFGFDYKRMDDRVALFLPIPMRTYAGGRIRAVPGFDGHYGTMAGPETQRVRMLQGDGSWYDFDNSLGTEVERDQYTLKFDYELGAGWKLAQALRYSDTRTQRNGAFPLSLSSAPKFFEQTAVKNLLATIPGATGWRLRYANDPAQAFDPANQNGNGLMAVGGLRGVTMPVKEWINDTRVMRNFDFGGQSHDVTLGYYYARFDQDFDRYSSNVLLDVRDNARLLDLVAVDAAGNPLATVTDHGIYRYGYEWENASGRSTTQAFYLSDEWQVSDRLRIDAGVRWEKVATEGWVELRREARLGTPATAAVLTGSGDFLRYDLDSNKTGWTIGANWQFSPHSGLFARWTSAFRLPNLSSYITRNSDCYQKKITDSSGVTRFLTQPECQAANDKPADTQTMDLGEIGYKYSDESFDLFATLFYTKYDNVGFSNTKFDLDNKQVTESGYASTRTFGLELEGSWYPAPWFDLQLTATVQDPQYRDLRYQELSGGNLVLRDYVGNQLIRVPKNSFRVVPGVNLFDDRLRLQVAYEYEGERFVDTANSVRLPSYDVVNASARWQATPELSLFLYADNLNNSLGLTEGNPRAGELQSADAGANTFLARPLLGRSYRLALMYKF